MMADVPVYMVVNLSITGPEEYRKYEKGFFPILRRHGGEFITFDDAAEVLEGTAPPGRRMVLFRFPTEAQARQWYADPEYQALSEHRRLGTDLSYLMLVHGMAPRG